MTNGWVTRTLADVCDFQNGYAFKSKWYSESGIRLLRNANMSHGFVDWSEDVVHLPENQAQDFERFSLNDQDVVLSLDRPVISTGLKAAILKPSDLPSLLLQRVLRITSARIEQEYIYRWLFSPLFLDQIDPGRSLGVPHISAKEVGDVPIYFPESKGEQKRIVSILDEAFGAIERAKENAQKNLANARELFESYLNRVFTEKGEGWEETTVGEVPSHSEQDLIVNSLDRLREQGSRLEVAYQSKLEELSELKQSILQKAFTGQLTAKSPELEAVS